MQRYGRLGWLKMSDAVKIALIGLICPIVTLLLNRLFSKRDKAENKAEDEIAALRAKHKEDMQATNQELTIICYGTLACLKGLAEQGCDGPVHDAIDRLEKHLNIQAHS